MSIDFNEFKDQAKKVLKIDFDGYKIERVERRTKSLMSRHDVKDFDQCLHLIKNEKEFREAYLNHFTINTSEFFRNPENFKFLENKVLPKLFAEKRKVRIWSAPCSNGSEPYSIAIILKEMGVRSGQFELTASDLDKTILAAAKQGVYKESSIKNVPAELRRRYFSDTGDDITQYAVNPEIKRMVNFEQKDLINDRFSANWDLILSRNFFIYLTKEMKDKLIKKFIGVLNDGGYFFLGNTEYIFTPQKYNLEKIYQSFYQYSG
ncbi:MAG: CheR family methyltransferase [Halanaerobium sp.]